jgi:hypothetical protein
MLVTILAIIGIGLSAYALSMIAAGPYATPPMPRLASRRPRSASCSPMPAERCRCGRCEACDPLAESYGR